MSALILRLAGPMQSWGLHSRFTVRDTGREPSKSGVIGLICAALGFSRQADQHSVQDRTIRLDDLARLKMAVRVDREGSLHRDYHTAGGGKLSGVKRYGVAKANRGTPGTVTSNRYYLADADFRVALQSDDDTLLRLLESALRQPVWPIFLGRKSFVPGFPVLVDRPDVGSVRPGLSLMDALQGETCYCRNAVERRRLESDPRFRCVVDADPSDGGSEVRPDVPLSFATRDYTIRHVSTSFLTLSPELIQEDPLCTSRVSS
jgi:CRISPR system Cascade subunit CasD